uniref:Uncharacterized protein n=1 Tax=viral metagenome TaxID=1070528 RepID=A0A6H1ZLV2_9ZZZZ
MSKKGYYVDCSVEYADKFIGDNLGWLVRWLKDDVMYIKEPIVRTIGGFVYDKYEIQEFSNTISRKSYDDTISHAGFVCDFRVDLLGALVFANGGVFSGVYSAPGFIAQLGRLPNCFDRVKLFSYLNPITKINKTSVRVEVASKMCIGCYVESIDGLDLVVTELEGA